MAERAQRVCRLQGCRILTRDPAGYCREHKIGHRKAKGDNKTVDPFYTSRRWLKVARWYNNSEPMCELCSGEHCKGRVAGHRGGVPCILGAPHSKTDVVAMFTHPINWEKKLRKIRRSYGR